MCFFTSGYKQKRNLQQVREGDPDTNAQDELSDTEGDRNEPNDQIDDITTVESIDISTKVSPRYVISI